MYEISICSIKGMHGMHGGIYFCPGTVPASLTKGLFLCYHSDGGKS